MDLRHKGILLGNVAKEDSECRSEGGEKEQNKSSEIAYSNGWTLSYCSAVAWRVHVIVSNFCLRELVSKYEGNT